MVGRRSWKPRTPHHFRPPEKTIIEGSFLDDDTEEFESFGGGGSAKTLGFLNSELTETPLLLDTTEIILAQKAEEFLEAFRAAQDSSTKDEISRAVLSELAPPAAVPAVALPDEAPALYLDRPNRQETAPDFIRRVYGPWLGQGLTRAHILHLDRPLYTALAKWLRSNDMPADLDLPTKAEQTTRQLQEMGVTGDDSRSVRNSVMTPEARKRQNLYLAARRRLD